jgi:hypothetical protein
MSDAGKQPGTGDAQFSHDELQSALFAQLVMQQSNLAMMLLGKGPRPEGGQPVRDLEAAKLFIDQLEMLEVKTKGNLSKEEGMLLKQSLMALRMAFVEAVESPAPPAKPAETPAPPAAPQTAPPAEPENKTAPTEDAGAAGEAESKKRYSKKFSL